MKMPREGGVPLRREGYQKVSQVIPKIRRVFQVFVVKRIEDIVEKLTSRLQNLKKISPMQERKNSFSAECRSSRSGSRRLLPNSWILKPLSEEPKPLPSGSDGANPAGTVPTNNGTGGA
jgi:hypothetical protein